MIESATSMLMLAADDGMDTTIQFVLFVIIAAGSVLGAVFKKQAEKKQQEQAQRKAQEAKEILARRAQREQAQRTAGTDASAGTVKKQMSLRDFIQSRTAAPSPPPRPKPEPSMFAAPPRPVILEAPEEHRLVDLTPIEHLPPEDQLIHTTLPSAVHRRKTSVGDLVRKRPMSDRVERHVSDVQEAPEPAASNVQTRVNLLDPATARAAIIFQEILSPPKALRDRPELWD